MLPLFVINLDHRPDRLKHITDECSRLGLDFVRIPAVNAQSATEEQLRSRANLDGTLCRRGLSRAEAACLLSHCHAWEMLLDTSNESALILEDDTRLSNDLPHFVESLDWWPNQTRLLQLHTHLPVKRTRSFFLSQECAPRHIDRQFRYILHRSLGCNAYMITRNGAQFLLENCYNIILPVDVLLFDIRLSRIARKLRPIQILPTLAQVWATDYTDIPYKEQSQQQGRIFSRRKCKSIIKFKYKIIELIWKISGYAEKMPPVWKDGSFFADKWPEQ